MAGKRTWEHNGIGKAWEGVHVFHKTLGESGGGERRGIRQRTRHSWQYPKESGSEEDQGFQSKMAPAQPVDAKADDMLKKEQRDERIH